MTTNGTRDFIGTQFLDTLGGLPISTVLPPANMPAKVEAFIQDTLAFWQTERVGPGPTGMQWVPKGGPGVANLIPMGKYYVNMPGVPPLTQFNTVQQAIDAARADRLAIGRTLANQPVCITVFPGAYPGYVSEAGVHVEGCASDLCGCTVFANFAAPGAPVVTFLADKPVPAGNLSNTSSLINAAVYTVSDQPAILVTGDLDLSVFLSTLPVISFNGPFQPPVGPPIALMGSGLCLLLEGAPNPRRTVSTHRVRMSAAQFPGGATATQPTVRGDTDYPGDGATDTPGLTLRDTDVRTNGAFTAALDTIGSVRGNGTRVLGRLRISAGIGKPTADFTDLEQAAPDQSQAAIQIAGVDLRVRDSRVSHTPATPVGFTYEAVSGANNTVTLLGVTAGPTVVGGVAGKRIGASGLATVASLAEQTIGQYSELRVTTPLVTMAEPFDLVVMDAGSSVLNLPPIANCPRGCRITVYNFSAGIVTVNTALGDTFFGGSVSEMPAAKERFILQSPAAGAEWWTLSNDP